MVFFTCLVMATLSICHIIVYSLEAEKWAFIGPLMAH